MCLRMKVGSAMKETIRTHVVLPKRLVSAVDGLVGQRHRSRYVEEAVEAKLQHDQQVSALSELTAAGGVLDRASHPEWATPEQTSAWVRQLRQEADEHTMRKIARTPSHDQTPA
jgi:hypothetical protein